MSIPNLPSLSPGQRYYLRPDHQDLKIFIANKNYKPNLNALNLMQQISTYIFLGLYPKQWHVLISIAKSVKNNYFEKLCKNSSWISNNLKIQRLNEIEDYYYRIKKVFKIRRENPASAFPSLPFPSSVTARIFAFMNMKEIKRVFLSNQASFKAWNSISRKQYLPVIIGEDFFYRPRFIPINLTKDLSFKTEAFGDTFKEAFAYLDQIQSIVKNKTHRDNWDDLIRVSRGIYFAFREHILCNLFLNTQNNQLEIKEVEKKYKEIKGFILPPKVFPLPFKMISKIYALLDLKDFKSVSSINTTARNISHEVALIKARSFNYQGEEDGSKAYRYLCCMQSLIRMLYKEGFLRNEFVVLDSTQKIEPLKTLQKLKELNIDSSLYLKPSEQHEKKTAIHFLMEELKKARRSDKTDLIDLLKSWIEALVDYGMDATIQDNNGDTLLHLAVNLPYEALELVKTLVSKKIDINKVNNKGETPLCLALCKKDTVDFLLQNGANPNYQNPQNGNTLFHYLAKKIKHNRWLEGSDIENLLISNSMGQSTLNLENKKGRTGEADLIRARILHLLSHSPHYISGPERELEARQFRILHGGSFGNGW